MSAALEKSLGLKGKLLSRFAAGEEDGLPFSALVQFQKRSGLPQKLIGDVIDLPKSTMRSRRTSGKLDRHESDRLIRLGRLFAQAVELFQGDSAAASHWLQNPCRALGYQTPLEYATTEYGAREVEAVIGRLEHGVFM